MTEGRRERARLSTRARATLGGDGITYVVPVSGGKDSQLVLARTVDEHGPARVRAIHNFTGIDHSLTMLHMKYMEERYGVRIEHTANPKYRDMRDLMDKKNMIPGRVARFCTDELKIQATNHWLQGSGLDLRRVVMLMGMRSTESQQREAKYAGIEPDDEFSLRDLNPHKVWARLAVVRCRLPIVTRTTQQVFDELAARGDKVNPLYARGHKRVGCYPCILAGKTDYRLAARDPEGRETVITLRDFKEVIAAKYEGKYEREVIIPHELDEILDHADNDPFGFYAEDEDDGDPGCQWCAQ